MRKLFGLGIYFIFLFVLMLCLTAYTFVKGFPYKFFFIIAIIIAIFLYLKHRYNNPVVEYDYNPNDDFIHVYEKIGFRHDEINKYPYLTNIYDIENEKVTIYSFKSNGNKIDKFQKNIELFEEVVNLRCIDVRRHIEIKNIIEILFVENIQAVRLNIFEEMKKEIKDYNTIQMDSLTTWNYRTTPHALITGVTRGGKTYILFFIIRQLLARKADMYIIDPKLSDLSTLDRVIGNKCAYEKDDIVSLVEKFGKEMKERYREMRKREDFKAGKDYVDYGYRPTFLIFDECMSFFGGSTEQSNKKTVKDYLLDVIAEGRQAGYFVILTTQRADTKFIDGAIRDQLGLRMSLGSLSSDGYKMTFGSSDYKLRDTTKGAGFIYVDGQGMEKAREYVSPFMPPQYDFFADFRNLVGEVETKKSQKNLQKEEQEKQKSINLKEIKELKMRNKSTENKQVNDK